MKENKKIIGIIAAVLVVLFAGLIGVSQDDAPSSAATTESLGTTVVESLYSDGLSEDAISEDASFGESATSGEGTSASSSPEKATSAQSTATSPTTATAPSTGSYKVNLSKIPAFSGKAYVTVNGNAPGLSAKDRTSTYFENYSPLDSMGRCGVAFACLGKETMPTEERGAIGSVKPTGWHTVKYDVVDGKYLYNRCHLIGFQLSGENANNRNLITGTRYLNVDGMLPFENMVADYIKETGNHVLYRVTPIFKSNELVARGVQIEAYSVEDEGEGICFNVYCYNNQPSIGIDYATGGSWLLSSASAMQTTTKPAITKPATTSSTEAVGSGDAEVRVWIPKSGKRYHSRSDCGTMKNPSEVSLEEAKEKGYTACGNCY